VLVLQRLSMHADGRDSSAVSLVARVTRMVREWADRTNGPAQPGGD